MPQFWAKGGVLLWCCIDVCVFFGWLKTDFCCVHLYRCSVLVGWLVLFFELCMIVFIVPLT